MLNLFKRFKKEYKTIDQYTEHWDILMDEEERLIYRINIGIKEAVAHPTYPIKLGIALPLQNIDSSKIETLKNSLEDTSNKILSENHNGVLTLAITSLGERKFLEFLFYTKEGLDFSTIHNMLKENFPENDVQMYAEHDPSWKTYSSYLK